MGCGVSLLVVVVFFFFFDPSIVVFFPHSAERFSSEHLPGSGALKSEYYAPITLRNESDAPVQPVVLHVALITRCPSRVRSARVPAVWCVGVLSLMPRARYTN